MATALQLELGLSEEAAEPSVEEPWPVPSPPGLRAAREALPGGREAAAVAAAGELPEIALTISGFYARLHSALNSAFPEEVWVTGEVRKVTERNGHRYIELADHEPAGPRGLQATAGRLASRWSGRGQATLDVACWARDWPRIAAALDAVGIELTPGLVVRVRGRVSVSGAGARVRLSLSALDVEALVGGIAAARRRLLKTLRAEGLIDANRSLVVSPVPLRVGLVTSPSSEAYRDFTGKLASSGMDFSTRFEPTLVQGAQAPFEVAAAIGRLQGHELDVIVLVRGGGAKGDLAAFDHEAVARAIVTSRHPVWTGIGHTGDRSVADEVANRALVTPTACGEALVEAVSAYHERLRQQARKLSTAAGRALEGSLAALAAARGNLSRAAVQELTREGTSLGRRRGELERSARLVLERCSSSLARRAERLGGLATGGLSRAGQELARQRALAGALDPRRQLERGWSLTRTSAGVVLRDPSQVEEGDELVTTLAGGTVPSVVRAPGQPRRATSKEGSG